jgi:membrane-associated phospholipid phosphatase
LETPFFNDTRRTAVLLAAGVLLILAGAALQGTSADVAAFRWVNGWGGALAWPGSVLSVLGLGASAFVLAGLLGVRRPQLVGAMLLALLGGGAVVHLFKALLAAQRPLAVLGADAVTVVGIALRAHSMPSGHATLAAGAFALAAAAPAAYYPTRHRWPWILALGLFALGVASARMLVGAHWTSDVVVGTGLGLVVGAVTTGSPWGRRACDAIGERLARPWPARLLGLVLLAVAWSLWGARRDYPVVWWLNALVALVGIAAAAGWWKRSFARPGSA